jgi:hypothetical protein
MTSPKAPQKNGKAAAAKAAGRDKTRSADSRREKDAPAASSEPCEVRESLEISHPDIDVDAIMGRIRASIQSKREAGILRDEAWLSRRLDASDLPGSARRGAERLGLIQMSGRLDLAGDPLKSHRPLTGWLIVGWKRFTRYWIRKYTDQLFTRQTHFNSEVLQMLAELARENDELRERLGKLEGAAGNAETKKARKNSGSADKNFSEKPPAAEKAVEASSSRR